MTEQHKVTDRNLPFTERVSTKICLEIPTRDNPFLTQTRYVHGYDMQQLMAKKSWVEVFFLLFKGELPSSAQAQLLEQLMLAFIHPGVRHPAVRAAMNAGVGKTEPAHMLPIALGVLGGEFAGAAEVEPCMRFIRTQLKKSPAEVAAPLLQQANRDTEGDWHIAPGFGCHFGEIDPFASAVAAQLLSLEGAGACLTWARDFCTALQVGNQGWLAVSVVAATLADLGFQPRMGAAIFQMIMAPGIAAQGIELGNKPITAMPFIKDTDYHIHQEDVIHD